MSTTEIDTAALAELFSKPTIIDVQGVPHALLPHNFKLESLEKLLPEPQRISRSVTAHDVTGLIAYTNAFKTEKTAAFCSPVQKPSIVVRLDDHQPGQPSRGTHSVTFNCATTTEWTTWTNGDKKQMDQITFAEFIENNLREITDPNGADMLTMVLNFKDCGSADFKSAVRLSDGRMQFQFIEKDNATEARFPETLKLAVPVFEGQPVRYEGKAKLRYRVLREEGLKLWYELDRPDLILRTAYADLLAHVEAQTGLSIYRAM